MPKREDLFAAASGEIQPSEATRSERVKRHGIDPKDTAYRDHRYPDPIGRPPKLNPEFVKAQRRIERIFPRFRSEHPELDARAAWIAAGKTLGVDIAAIAP